MYCFDQCSWINALTFFGKACVSVTWRSYGQQLSYKWEVWFRKTSFTHHFHLKMPLPSLQGERALEFVLGLYGLSALILFLLLLSHSWQIIGVQLQNCCEKRTFKWFLHIQDFLGASAAFFQFWYAEKFLKCAKIWQVFWE